MWSCDIGRNLWSCDVFLLMLEARNVIASDFPFFFHLGGGVSMSSYGSEEHLANQNIAECC